MLQATRWQWPGLMMGTPRLLCGLAGGATAQEKKSFDKHDASALNAALKDVINAGANLYNDNGDHRRTRAHRLPAVGSLLRGADLQKKIDASLAGCDQADMPRRAHELRKVLDEIRARTKASEVKKMPDTKKMPDITEPESKEKGEVAGTLVFQGKGVAGGYLVTLISGGGKKFSAAIKKDGSFLFPAPIPVGEYRIAIEAVPDAQGPLLPDRYGSEKTSGLAIRVQKGKQHVDLNLVK